MLLRILTIMSCLILAFSLAACESIDSAQGVMIGLDVASTLLEWNAQRAGAGQDLMPAPCDEEEKNTELCADAILAHHCLHEGDLEACELQLRLQASRESAESQSPGPWLAYWEGACAREVANACATAATLRAAPPPARPSP